MAIDIDIYNLTYSKNEVDTMITAEENRVDALLLTKVDLSLVGGDNGLAQLSGGLIAVANIDWASNVDALAGTATDKVMTPLRVKEAHEFLLSDVGGAVQVTTLISQLNTFGLTPTKATYFNNTEVITGSHFTVNSIDQEITINTTGIYRIGGTISFDGPDGTVVRIAPRINAVQKGPINYVTCLGTGNLVGLSYNILVNLTAGDVFTLYGEASIDSSNIYMTQTSFGLEKIVHG